MKSTQTILQDLEKTAQNFWNVPHSTGELLQAFILLINAQNVLEIGTSNGYSAIHMGLALQQTGGHLYTIESHKGRYQLAQENIQKAGLTSIIHQYQGHAPDIFIDPQAKGYEEFYQNARKKFDLIFLDATKMEYLQYLEALLPYLRNKGFIIADNCLSHQKELAKYCQTVMKHPLLQSYLLELDNGLMISCKIDQDDGNLSKSLLYKDAS